MKVALRTRTGIFLLLIAALACAMPACGTVIHVKPKAGTANPLVKGTKVFRTPGSGAVIFAKTRDGSPTGPADVFRVDLATGKAERLISAETLPTDVSGLALSPDGNCLAIVQGDEWDDEQSVWLWTFGNRKLRLLIKGPGLLWRRSPVQWSPSGRYLLIAGQDGAKICSLATGKRSKIDGFETLRWLSKRDSLLGISESDKEPGAAYLTSLDGKRQRIVKWSREISNVAESPDGRGYAIRDRHGVYLVKPGSVRRLGVRFASDYEGAWNDADFAYNSMGTKLAVLAAGAYGEPHISSVVSLWLVRPTTGKVTKLTEWQDSQLEMADSAVPSRDLVGWFADDKRVALLVDFTWGEDLTNLRTDQHNLDTYDTTKRKRGTDTIRFGRRMPRSNLDCAQAQIEEHQTNRRRRANVIRRRNRAASKIQAH